MRLSCEETTKYPDNPADISSINNLAYKPSVSLDPKIRKALLNVLNQLELNENYKPEAELAAIQSVRSSSTNDTAEGVKWEYKANDTFKEYNYYEVSADDPLKSNPSFGEEKLVDEPGALFFQIPEIRESTTEKHESLNLQETKNFLSNADLLVSDFDEGKQPTETPRPAQNVTKKRNEIDEKDVEVFQAPLLTAFTLEQDERGLPRRIIPLEPSELRSLLDNRVQTEPPDVRRSREPAPIFRNPINVSPLLLDEQKRFRLELESQFQELQERKRQIELEKDRLFAEHEKARRLKYALDQRQKEQEYFRLLSQNEVIRPEIAFQKSIEPQFSFNLGDNRPALFEPAPVPVLSSRLVHPSHPDTVDRQLQNLFHRSGLGRQEDLNIVSKILAFTPVGDEDKVKVKRT